MSPTLSSRLLISEGDMFIFLAEASMAKTVKAKRSNASVRVNGCPSMQNKYMYG